MATSTVLFVVAIIAAIAWGILFGGRLPAPFGARSCQGKNWRRSFALPHVVTLALGLYLIPVYLAQTTIGGNHVCSVRENGRFHEAPSLLQQVWAPAWLAILMVLGYVVVLHWRKTHADRHG